MRLLRAGRVPLSALNPKRRRRAATGRRRTSIINMQERDGFISQGLAPIYRPLVVKSSASPFHVCTVQARPQSGRGVTVHTTHVRT